MTTTDTTPAPQAPTPEPNRSWPKRHPVWTFIIFLAALVAIVGALDTPESNSAPEREPVIDTPDAPPVTRPEPIENIEPAPDPEPDIDADAEIDALVNSRDSYELIMDMTWGAQDADTQDTICLAWIIEPNSALDAFVGGAMNDGNITDEPLLRDVASDHFDEVCS